MSGLKISKPESCLSFCQKPRQSLRHEIVASLSGLDISKPETSLSFCQKPRQSLRKDWFISMSEARGHNFQSGTNLTLYLSDKNEVSLSQK